MREHYPTTAAPAPEAVEEMAVGYRVYGSSAFSDNRSPFGFALPSIAEMQSYCALILATATTTVHADNEGWTCTVPAAYTQTATKLGNGRCCHPDQGAECSPTTGGSLYRGGELGNSIQSLDEISGVSGTPGNGAACRAECEARYGFNLLAVDNVQDTTTNNQAGNCYCYHQTGTRGAWGGPVQTPNALDTTDIFTGSWGGTFIGTGEVYECWTYSYAKINARAEVSVAPRARAAYDWPTTFLQPVHGHCVHRPVHH